MKERKTKLFCKQAGIEPRIGLLRQDHQSGFFYKWLQGDAMNVLLSAAAFNFKKAMKTLLFLVVKSQKIQQEFYGLLDLNVKTAS